MTVASQWSEITSFANICRAAKRAARGQRRVWGAARFLERLEIEALALQRELVSSEWRPARPTTFTLHDPKERVITAAPFRERVAQHALVDPLEPLFDAALVHESFACRRGKGTHAAIAHARELVRAHRYFLKLDVHKCFDSIGHQVVLDTLAPLRLEPEVTDLCARVLAGASGTLGVGLPIGNLTSQWFANLVLGRVDRFVLGELGTGGYVRYMDDFALFGEDKLALKRAHGAIEAFVRDELKLALEPRATILAPVSEGLPFLGWNLHRGTQRIRPQNLRRLRRRLRHRAWERRTGRIGDSAFVAAVRSAMTHLAHGDTQILRLRWLRAFDDTPHFFDNELGSGSPATATASTAAAASTTPLRTRGRRTATTPRPRTRTTISAFAPPMHRTARSRRSTPLRHALDAQIRFPCRERKCSRPNSGRRPQTDSRPLAVAQLGAVQRAG